jgi:hypothetical protein
VEILQVDLCLKEIQEAQELMEIISVVAAAVEPAVSEEILVVQRAVEAIMELEAQVAQVQMDGPEIQH